MDKITKGVVFKSTKHVRAKIVVAVAVADMAAVEVEAVAEDDEIAGRSRQLTHV